MQKLNYLFTCLAILGCSLISCTPQEATSVPSTKGPSEASKTLFVSTMQKHLNAVTNKDIETLKSTLSPTGKMQLVLPKTEMTSTVDEFVKYHADWFADTTTVWSFKTKILDTTIGETMGIAITEILYSEPLRDGKPYFNRMNVTYALQKQNDQWYIIKDHASSIHKSTD